MVHLFFSYSFLAYSPSTIHRTKIKKFLLDNTFPVFFYGCILYFRIEIILIKLSSTIPYEHKNMCLQNALFEIIFIFIENLKRNKNFSIF